MLKRLFANFFDYKSRIGRIKYIGQWSLWLSICFSSLICAMSFDEHRVGMNIGLLTLEVVLGIVMFLSVLKIILLSIRRLHDTECNGWHLLFVIIPFVGWIYFIYIMLGGGTKGDNRYGAPTSKPTLWDQLLMCYGISLYIAIQLYSLAK